MTVQTAKRLSIRKEDEKTPLGEFILSYYDRETMEFPKGETAVLTMVEKDYGDAVLKPACQRSLKIYVSRTEDTGQNPASPIRKEELAELERIEGLSRSD